MADRALQVRAEDRPGEPGRRPPWFGLRLALGFGLCALFLYACLTPNPPGPPPGLPFVDKLEHGFAFVVMGAWFGALFPFRLRYVLLCLSLFAALTEVLQAMGGYRDGDPMDWLADMLGLVLGLVLIRAGAARWFMRQVGRVTTAGN